MLFLLAEVAFMKYEGLHAIAVLEGVNGVLALLVAASVILLTGEDLHTIVQQDVNLGPLSFSIHHIRTVLLFVEKLMQNNLILVVVIALMYASFRFVMAFGLWHRLRWTEWFAFISGSLYIPFEIYALYHQLNVINVSILLFNLAIVSYLYWVLRRGPGSKA